MARPRRILNDAKPKVIEEEILKQDPEGLEPAHIDESEVVIATHIPEMKRVMFLNGRDPGVPLEFHYHSKTHRLKQYKLLHGHEYDLALEVIEHLEGCREPQYAYRKGPDGHPEHYVCGYKYIFQCRNPVKKVA